MTTERPHKKMTAKRMTLGSLEKERKEKGNLIHLYWKLKLF